MSVVYIALPAVLLLALAGVIAFIWAVRSGQMDDLDTPGLRILGDDDEAPSPLPSQKSKVKSPKSDPLIVPAMPNCGAGFQPAQLHRLG